MRRLNYIWVLCFALLSVACNKENIIPEGDDSSIIVPEGGPYIYLDAIVKNKTRGTLIEGNELQGNFGTYGYTYNFKNRWSTYRITATPNVFKKANGEGFSAPQEVVYNNGIYSYTPVQTWSGGKYTFFAYYPFEHNSIKEKSGIDDQGTPWVKYAPSDFLTSTDGHIDVMTAMFEDTSLSSSQYVNFDFKHCLSAIDVVALNFYEYNQNEGGNVASERITIEITDLNIAFTNLDYKAATFYLDSSIPYEPTPIASTDPKPSYNILSGGPKLIEYSTTSEFQHIDKSQTLLVIPQTDEDLEVTTTVSFKKKRANGTYLSEIPDEAVLNKDYKIQDGIVTYISSKTTEFGQALKAGSRYFIQITFTSAAVSINILTSAEWEDLAEDVYHEFE